MENGKLFNSLYDLQWQYEKIISSMSMPSSALQMLLWLLTRDLSKIWHKDHNEMK